MKTRRDFLAATAAISAAGLGVGGPSHAQGSNKITRLIVPVPAGTALDTSARLLADQFRGLYAETLIVENKVGAAGRIGMDVLKNSAPDGTTFALVPGSFLTTYPYTYPKLNYSVQRDFTVVGVVGSYTFGMALGPAVSDQVKTPADFAAWAKQQTRQPIQFSGNGQGTSSHFLGLKFAQQYGISMEFIPFAGAPDAMRALVGGDIPAIILNDSYLRTFAKSDTVRVLASFGAVRSPQLPDAPTFKELGRPELVMTENLFLLMPKNTPPAQAEKLLSAWTTVAAKPEVQATFSAQGMSVIGRQEAGYATELVKSESAKMAVLVKASGFSFKE